MRAKIQKKRNGKNKFFAHGREKQKSTFSVLFVVLPGFEPRQADPESDVLPLHHRTIGILSLSDEKFTRFARVLFFRKRVQKYKLFPNRPKKNYVESIKWKVESCDTVGCASKNFPLSTFHLTPYRVSPASSEPSFALRSSSILPKRRVIPALIYLLFSILLVFPLR